MKKSFGFVHKLHEVGDFTVFLTCSSKSNGNLGRSSKRAFQMRELALLMLLFETSVEGICDAQSRPLSSRNIMNNTETLAVAGG